MAGRPNLVYWFLMPATCVCGSIMGGVFVDHEFDPNEQKHDVVREIEIAEDVVKEVLDFKQAEKSLHEKIEKLLLEKE